MPLHVGDTLPRIEAQTQIGPIVLPGFQDAKFVVLWAYPKDATSG